MLHQPQPYCSHPQLVLISLERVKRAPAFHQMLLYVMFATKVEAKLEENHIYL